MGTFASVATHVQYSSVANMSPKRRRTMTGLSIYYLRQSTQGQVQYFYKAPTAYPEHSWPLNEVF